MTTFISQNSHYLIRTDSLGEQGSHQKSFRYWCFVKQDIGRVERRAERDGGLGRGRTAARKEGCGGGRKSRESEGMYIIDTVIDRYRDKYIIRCIPVIGGGCFYSIRVICKNSKFKLCKTLPVLIDIDLVFYA